MKRIIVVGSINMDIVAQTHRHPRPGETVIGSQLHYFPGGKGSNQAVAASRLAEGNVFLVGKLGQDAFGNTMTEFLRHENLHLDYLTYSEDKPTGIALIVLDDESENTIVVVPGSNAELSYDDMDAARIKAGDIVVSQFEIPQESIRRLFRRSSEVGAVNLLNPAPATMFVPGLLELTDYLIVNETELALFTGDEIAWNDIRDIRAQALKLQTRATQTIVVTLGVKGVVCLHNDDLIEIPGFPVKAVDTTGAGDCFVGALAVSLADDKPMQEALSFANAAAALSVQRMGASTSMPGRSEVDALLNNPR